MPYLSPLKFDDAEITCIDIKQQLDKFTHIQKDELF